MVDDPVNDSMVFDEGNDSHLPSALLDSKQEALRLKLIRAEAKSPKALASRWLNKTQIALELQQIGRLKKREIIMDFFNNY